MSMSQWVKICHGEIMLELFSKGLIRAIGKICSLQTV